MRVEQLMSRDVKVCLEDDTLNRAAELMWEADCGVIVVIRGNGTAKIVGMVTDRDVAIAAYTQGKQLWAIPVASAMAREVVICRTSDDVGQAELLMRKNSVRRLPVIDEREHLVGLISLSDLAQQAHRDAASGKREVAGSEIAETLAAVSRRRVPREIEITV